MRRRVALLAVLLLLAACDRGDPAAAANPAPPGTATVPPAVPSAEANGETVPPPGVPADIVATPAPRAPVVPREVDNHADVPRPGDEASGPSVDHEDPPHDAEAAAEFEPDGDDAPRPGRPPAAPHWDGIADLRFGMSADEIRARWRGELDDHAADDAEACFYLAAERRRPADSPALMFVSGRFVRYDVDSPALRAPGGGAVGMDTFEILERYGENRIERRPHKYSEGEYLRIEAPDQGSILLFETGEDGAVTEWRIGVEPQVDYVEGCS